MATRDTIVIGASAGGVQALSTLIAELPPDLQAAVFIVLHIPSHVPSLLPHILSRDARIPVAHAVHGEVIRPGRAYVAPPDHHLLIEDTYVKLVRGPKENLHRPSIDALFRSVARSAGTRAIGVILTGALDESSRSRVGPYRGRLGTLRKYHHHGHADRAIGAWTRRD